MNVQSPGLLPPVPDAIADRAAILRLSRARKLVVLDDDPTGTQTVHEIDVLTEWSVTSLIAALSNPESCVFILTNSRALPENEAVSLIKNIVAGLARASAIANRGFVVVSRSDSTLRGHLAGEIEAIVSSLEHPVAGVCLIPALVEAGRFTIHGTHYLREGELLTPVAQTEFARDRTFGYRCSHLPDWIQEKTGGRVPAKDVVTIPLEVIRGEGARGVLKMLMEARLGSWIVCDAACHADLEIFSHASLLAEASGRLFVYRTAAGFVRVRAALPARDVLPPAALVRSDRVAGLVVIGSYVDKTTRQLDRALQMPGILPIELSVHCLAQPGSREIEIARAAKEINAGLLADRHVVVYTSRITASAVGNAGEINAGQAVSTALVEMVRRVGTEPRFFIAKGGNTSSDIAVRALGVRKARILGQAAPGIPVWRFGPESRFPGMAYVVFPGNVGEDKTLALLIEAFSPPLPVENASAISNLP